MKTCPICNFTENPGDAIFCIRCHRPLPIAQHVIFEPEQAPGSTVLVSPPDEDDPKSSLVKKPVGLDEMIKQSLNAPRRTRHEGRLQRYDVAIYVMENEEPLIASVTRDVIIGRNTAGYDADQAQVDLGEFGALEYGVSRHHVLLKRFGPDVGIIDLESRNGTWLNGVRLQPRQSFMLRNGDRVMLAHLPIYIYVAPPTGRTGMLPPVP